VLVVLLVGVVVLVSALVGPLAPQWHQGPSWLDITISPPPGQLPLTQMTPAGDLSPQVAGSVPGWLTAAMRGLALAVGAVLLFFAGRQVHRALRDRYRSVDAGEPETEQPGGREELAELDDLTQAALEEGLAAARRALRRELPPGDAVIAAWLALERAAQAGGIARDPALTATEFTLGLLDRTPADPAAARTLLRLYHRARFSEHPVSARDVIAARTALETLAVGLPRVSRAAGALASPDGVAGARSPASGAVGGAADGAAGGAADGAWDGTTGGAWDGAAGGAADGAAGGTVGGGAR